MSNDASLLPRLSWSQIQSYTQCPAKWWFSRNRPPESTPSALKFGSAIHAALAAYHLSRLDGCSLTVDEMLEVYANTWSKPENVPIRYGKDESEEFLTAMAGRIFNAFLDKVDPGEVLAVEKGFAVDIGDSVLVTGYIDMVEIKEGCYWIVDYKTSKGTPSTAFDSEQVGLYLLGLKSLGFIPEQAKVRLRYDVLKKLKTKSDLLPVEITVSEKSLEDLKGKLTQVWRAMEANIIYRVKSWACQGCRWSRACKTTDFAVVLSS